MTERDFGPRIPEKLLAEAKQQFNEALLRNEIIVAIFDDLLAKGGQILAEPYSSASEYGIYIEVQSIFVGPKSDLVIHETYHSHVPIFIKDHNGNFSKISPLFVKGMQDRNIGDEDIKQIIQLFEINAEKVQHAVPGVKLKSEPRNFTWIVIRE